jgi:hypothetical protein
MNCRQMNSKMTAPQRASSKLAASVLDARGLSNGGRTAQAYNRKPVFTGPSHRRTGREFGLEARHTLSVGAAAHESQRSRREAATGTSPAREQNGLGTWPYGTRSSTCHLRHQDFPWGPTIVSIPPPHSRAVGDSNHLVLAPHGVPTRLAELQP